MENVSLILNRRREVEQEIGRLKTRLSDMQTELVELETAERVFARLSGAKRPQTGKADEQKPAEAPKLSTGQPIKMSVPQKIQHVLAEAYRQGLPHLEPKDIAKRVNEKWPGTGKSENIGAIVWRMWKAKRLVKADRDLAMYALPFIPGNEKPADLLSEEEQSAGLSDQPARAGEPGQEVGHDNIS